MNVMIFAAGLGTRMRPLTDTRPKALIKVAGRALMDHALEQAHAANPGRIVVNGHHHANQLRAHLGSKATFLEEQPAPLETGGGLRAALPVLGDDPVMTLNADMAWSGPRAGATLTRAWDPAHMDGLLLLVSPDTAIGTPGGWRFTIAPDGRIARADTGLIFTGAAIVKTQGLHAIPGTAFSLRELWLPMLEAGRLCGVQHPGGWADVGTPEGIAPAEAMLAQARDV